MKKIIQTFLFSILLTVSSSLTAHQGCNIVGFLGAEILDAPNLLNMELYKPFESILFLADTTQKDRGGYQGLAERVHETYPDKKLTKTDYAILGSSKNGTLTKQFLDNTKTFPFDDNQFDSVVMKRGLCFCSNNISCGGLTKDLKCALRFFGEVARVLNKNNPNAKAMLQGRFGVNDEILKTWNEAAIEIMKKENVQFRVVYTDRGVFDSLQIYPTPIEEP